MKQPRRLYMSAALLLVLLVALVVSVMNWSQASAASNAHVHRQRHIACWGFFCFFTRPSPSATATPTPAQTVGPTSTPSPTSSTRYTTAPDAAQAVLDLINQERASMNLPALKMNSQLIQSAHLHNIAMREANTLSHQLPGEADLGKRISAQGVNWSMVAENIGYGWGDARQAALDLNRSMFAEQPPNDGHRRNILSNANVVGIDVIVDTQNSKVWLTEDFARI
jgi:uncharacterized protein YkwD